MTDFIVDYDNESVHNGLRAMAEDLKLAFEEDDIVKIGKLVYLYDTISTEIVDSSTHPEQFMDTMSTARSFMKKWKESLAVGSYFDLYDPKYSEWYNAKILRCEGNMFHVHFIGWDASFDRDVDMNTSIILPTNTVTKPRTKGTKKSTSFNAMASSDNITTDTDAYTNVVESTLTQDENVITTSSGRIIRTKFTTCAISSFFNTSKSTRSRTTLYEGREVGLDRNEPLCDICGFLNGESEFLLCDGPCLKTFHMHCLQKKYKLKSIEVKDDEKWYCDECTRGEHRCFLCNISGKDLTEVCQCSLANCGKYYHADCLLKSDFILPTSIKFNDVSTTEIDSITDIAKPTTTTKRRRTSSSSSGGGRGKNKSNTKEKDNTYHDVQEVSEKENRHDIGHVETNIKKEDTQETELTIDSNDMCGEGMTTTSNSSCTTSEVLTSTSTSITATTLNTMTTPSTILHKPKKLLPAFKFKCPYHDCYNCHEFYGHTKDTLSKCIYCPRSYHENCFPPGCRYNSTFFVCPRHPDKVLPNESSTSNTMEIQTQSKGNKSKDGNNINIIWDQMTLPDQNPSADNILHNHFCLPVQYREIAKSEPRPYKHINKLIYRDNTLDRVQYYISNEECNCIGYCGVNCYNRQVRIECNDTICNVGNDCGNRRLQYSQYAKTEVFQEFEMGWGLRTIEEVKTNELVTEYLGEVIDEYEMRRRLLFQRLNTPSDKDYYVMALENQFYVDGKYYGNESRFINHSCDPNCELQLWHVQGRMHIAICAIRNLEPGEPLSYDYQFETNEEDTFKCYCKKDKCRGTMAPKKKIHTSLKSVEMMRIKDKKLLLDTHKRKMTVEKLVESEWNRSLTSKHLPGDSIHEIRNGPLRSTFKNARYYRIFLPRNIELTQDFMKRKIYSLSHGSLAASSSSSQKSLQISVPVPLPVTIIKNETDNNVLLTEEMEEVEVEVVVNK